MPDHTNDPDYQWKPAPVRTISERARAALDDMGVFEDLIRDHAALVARDRTLSDLLRRLREWDHMPTAGDGPFWIAEIDKALNA